MSEKEAYSILGRAWNLVTNPGVVGAVTTIAGLLAIVGSIYAFLIFISGEPDEIPPKPPSQKVFEGVLTQNAPSADHEFGVGVNDLVQILPRVPDDMGFKQAYYDMKVTRANKAPVCSEQKWSGSAEEVGNGMIFRAVEKETLVLTVRVRSADPSIEYGSYKIVVLFGDGDASDDLDCKQIKAP